MILRADKIAQQLEAPDNPADPLVLRPQPDLATLRNSGSASVDLRLGCDILVFLGVGLMVGTRVAVGLGVGVGVGGNGAARTTISTVTVSVRPRLSVTVTRKRRVLATVRTGAVKRGVAVSVLSSETDTPAICSQE